MNEFSQTGECLDFDDLTVIQIPVKYQGKVYLLCEADGEAGTKYRNFSFSAVRASKGGENLGVEGLASREPLLVSLCLFLAERVPGTPNEQYRLLLDNDKNPQRVSEEFVHSLPSKMVQRLFKKALEISELTDTTGTLEELKEQRNKLDEKIATQEREKRSVKNV